MRRQNHGVLSAKSAHEAPWPREVAGRFYELYEEEGQKVMRAFASKQGKQYKWPATRAARVKRIWLDYGKTGVVRDEKGMADIAHEMLLSIARLSFTTDVLEHGPHSTNEVLEVIGLEPLTVEEGERLGDFLTDARGQWLLSDYGLKPAQESFKDIFLARTGEEQLLAVDRLFNIVHRRGDFACFFVEKGSKTLDAIFEQTGELPQPKGKVS